MKNSSVSATKVAILGAFLAGLILPASAPAEYYVPPGNSAANQYTESLPSAGGESAGKGGGGHKGGGNSGGGGTATPEQSLGARNAHRLEAQGPAGEAAAELAAETAPPAGLVRADEGTEPTPKSGGPPQRQGSGKPAHSKQQGGDDKAAVRIVHVNQPSGSSGVGELVAQATGSSDDSNLGLWLPILILATVAGSIGYGLRARHGPTA
jgi:hypothetical protein